MDEPGIMEASKATEEPENTDTPRAKVRPEEEVIKLIHRLTRLEGQIRGIRAMVERNAYCTDILTQALAASAALDSFRREVLASHIRGCVAEDLREGREESLEELLFLLKKLMR